MSELLLPELLWQTLAWSVLFTVLAVIALQHSTRYAKRALGLFFIGLSISYVLSFFVNWRSPILSTAVLYLGLVTAFIVLAIGCYFIYEFFKRHSVTIKPEVGRDFTWIGAVLRKKRPAWLFIVTGFIVGLLEPLQLSQYHYSQRYLLLEQTAPGHISSLFHAVFITLLPMLLIVLIAGGVYVLLTRRQNTDSYNHHLFVGHSYIIISWLLLAISAGFLRI